MTTHASPSASAPDASGPILDIAGTRATLRLNRPAVHNRIEPADLDFIRSTIRQLNADDRIRVLVITGTGKTFSSGFHLGELGGSVARASSSEPNGFEAMTDELENARVITIARLNGPVYGGATDLALACDFRIGVDHARMFMPAARLGLHYYGHGIRRWVSRLGLNAAKRLFLTDATIDAQEMLRIGYLDEVATADTLDERVDTLIATLGKQAPRVVETMMQMLNETARGEYDHERADALHRASLGSHDIKEALDAFANKREPVFTGA
jgi:enoyl-CoA hydratase